MILSSHHNSDNKRTTQEGTCEVIDLPEWPSADYFPPDAMDRHLPELCAQITGCRVFSWECFCLMIEHCRLYRPPHLVSLLRMLVKDFLYDLKSVFLEPRQRLNKADCLIVSNIPHNRLMLMKTARRFAQCGKTVAWYGTPIIEADDETYANNLVDLGSSSVSRWGQPRDILKLWLSLPTALYRGVILSHRMREAYAKIAKIKVRVSALQCALHWMRLERCRWLMKRLRPKSVILGFDSVEFAGAVAISGYEQQAEVMVLQHGVLNPVTVYSLATRIGCWSKDTCEYVQALQISPQTRRTPELKADVVGAIHAPERLSSLVDRKGVLFLGQWADYTYWQWGGRSARAILHWLNQLQKSFPAVEWRFRPHPAANPRDVPAGWIVSDYKSLRDDLECASVTITMNSTSGVEAGAMGRPVIFLWSPEMVWLNAMASLKALFVRSPDELVLRVGRLLNDPDFYQTYTDISMHLCSRHLGLHKNAVDTLVSIFLSENEQA